MTAHNSKKILRPAGFTLIEMLMAIVIVAIPTLAIGTLLVGASRGWQKIYADTNSEIRQDAMVLMTSLQTFGRQANITNYEVYKAQNGAFVAASPASGESVAAGQAVEFRYWGEHFNPADPGNDMLGFGNTGTHYALYYLDGENLKVDFGVVVNDVGAIQNGSRQTANITTTQILAHHVNISKTPSPFSHTLDDGEGSGCINTNLTLTDTEGVSIDMIFATMLRSAWPR
jgi:prepilin-type N-terminal cleavage/methylation domain-containing protein